jgi:hypothetical protein
MATSNLTLLPGDARQPVEKLDEQSVKALRLTAWKARPPILLSAEESGSWAYFASANLIALAEGEVLEFRNGTV